MWVDRARNFATDIVKWYESKEGARSGSRSVSGDRGTEKHHGLQWRGKVGEVALALYFDLDPEKAVRWKVGFGSGGRLDDKGWDIISPNGVKCDVKSTPVPWNLIWSRTVNHLYQSKDFDVLVAVSTDNGDEIFYESNYSNAIPAKAVECWIEGYITKQCFYRRKKIKTLDDGGPRLEIGTWYISKCDLTNFQKKVIDDYQILNGSTYWSDVRKFAISSPRDEKIPKQDTPTKSEIEFILAPGETDQDILDALADENPKSKCFLGDWLEVVEKGLKDAETS